MANKKFSDLDTAAALMGNEIFALSQAGISKKSPLSAIKTFVLSTLSRSDVGLSNVDNTSDINKPVSTATQTAINGRIASTEKGAANGVAPLDSIGKIAATYLPSYVDDVLEFTNTAAFPATGETGKIYVALDTNKIYRWSGSTYIEISASPGSTDAITEGAGNLYFTAARVLATVLTSLSTATNAVITASDTVLIALGKLQAQISGIATSVSAKLPGAYNPVIILAQTAVAASITGTLTETTLAAITIPGGMMGASGSLRITPLFSYTNNANNKFCRIRFGGTAFTDIGNTTTASLQPLSVIRNRTSSSQVCMPGAGIGGSSGAIVTGAINTAVDQSVTITAQLGNVADTITLEGYIVELIRS